MIKGILKTEENIIKTILSPYLQSYEFYFYGSRVKGTHTKVSDLDILIKGASEIPSDVKEEIKQQFDESALPYIVHFADYQTIDKTFYEIIKKDLIPIF